MTGQGPKKPANVYEDLVLWFRESGAYVPESGSLIPLMQACYRPEEAELLCGMPLNLTDLDDLADLKGIAPARLTSALDELAGRGLVYRASAGGRLKYRVNPPRFVFLRSFFWPGTDNAHIRSVAPWVSTYYRDGFGDHWKLVQTKGLRALPVRRTIEDPRRILPYEDVREVLGRQDRFAVAHCACRHRNNMDVHAPDCKHEVETCLHFGKLADYIVENRLGRKISRQEAEGILNRAADAGLVHAVSNWQDNVDTICNCCRCCCVYFQGFHVLKHSASMSHSDYQVVTNPATCIGCGLCVKRCPMEALKLTAHPAAKNKRGEASVLQPDLCIGCGICAHKCPSGSLKLRQRAERIAPPVDVEELKRRYVAEQQAAGRSDGIDGARPGSHAGDISSGEAVE